MLWKVETRRIPIVVGALGTVPKGLEKKLRKELLQKAAFLGTARILRKVVDGEESEGSQAMRRSSSFDVTITVHHRTRSCGCRTILSIITSGMALKVMRCNSDINNLRRLR